MEHIVVVGAGLAGARAADQLRKDGYEGRLTIVGDEEHGPYTRPPLSKQLLAGEMTDGECAIKSDRLEDADWRLGARAVGLDVDAGRLELAGGDALDYDGLVIATGRRAREWPDLPDLDGFFTLRSLDDAKALREAVSEDSRVVIVGAGFIGCEVAATLRTGGTASVTLLEAGPHPLLPLGPEAGERAQAVHADHGVDVRVNAKVASFAGEGHVERVILEDGEEIDADVVLLALGSVPNTEWLLGSGLELDAGGAVVADVFCVAEGADNVVVAGDCAAWPHPHAAGDTVSIEHWTHASDMGRAAAKSLLADPGDRTPYDAVPTFWSDQYDVKIKSAGLFHRADTREVVHDEDGALVVEGHRDDDLVGAVTFNKNKTWMEYRRRLTQALSSSG